MRVELTDTEWVRVLDGHRDDSALPLCCANVSELRDDMIALVRNGGESNPFFQESIRRHVTWVYPEHGEPSDVIAKIIEQLEIAPYSEDGIADAIEQEYSRRHAKLKVEFG